MGNGIEKASSELLPFFEPALQRHRGDPDRSSKSQDRQVLLADQLVDLRSPQAEGFACLGNVLSLVAEQVR